jgi:hypothetical protein
VAEYVESDGLDRCGAAEWRNRRVTSPKSSTAGCSDHGTTGVFEVTHPFHPQRGEKWVLATRRVVWGEDRVNYFDQQGKLCSMLTAWTDLAALDFFAQASQGRSWFRVDDLLALSALVRLQAEDKGVK